jgi:hypothetical protein
MASASANANIRMMTESTLSNTTVFVLFDVSASNVFSESNCSKYCIHCNGSLPIQVCSFRTILHP